MNIHDKKQTLKSKSIAYRKTHYDSAIVYLNFLFVSGQPLITLGAQANRFTDIKGNIVALCKSSLTEPSAERAPRYYPLNLLPFCSCS